MHEAIRILLYAIVAAASPTALLATLAVLSSRRARLNGILFMGGFMFSQALALLIVYLLGASANNTSQPVVNAYVELAAGVAIVVIAITRPELRKPRAPRGSPRTAALLERLRRVTPSVSLGIGALLGVGAKRFALTLIAAGTLALSDTAGMTTFWLGVLYVLVATVIVWLPVIYSAILGRRAEDLVAKVRRSTESRGRRRANLVGGVLGGLLIVDSLTRLLA